MLEIVIAVVIGSDYRPLLFISLIWNIAVLVRRLLCRRRTDSCLIVAVRGQWQHSRWPLSASIDGREFLGPSQA